MNDDIHISPQNIASAKKQRSGLPILNNRTPQQHSALEPSLCPFILSKIIN